MKEEEISESLLQRFLAWLGKTSDPVDRIKRNLFLLAIIALLSLLPLTLNPSSARIWSPVLALVIFVGFLLVAGGASFLTSRLESLTAGGAIVLFGREIKLPAAEARGVFSWAWQILTRLGLLFPAVIFFLFWTFLYIAAWSFDPGVCPADPAISCPAAFAGLGKAPTLGDFLYFAVNMAFANPVPDILATSRLTHTLVTLEVISGIALATLYAGAFFGFARERR